jgi:hypothetical protein
MSIKKQFSVFAHFLIVDEPNHIQENEINISMVFNLYWQTASLDYFFLHNIYSLPSKQICVVFVLFAYIFR